MLTLTPAPSGRGMLLRDSNTRVQILIEGKDLTTIGMALIEMGQSGTIVNRAPRRGGDR